MSTVTLCSPAGTERRGCITLAATPPRRGALLLNYCDAGVGAHERALSAAGAVFRAGEVSGVEAAEAHVGRELQGLLRTGKHAEVAAFAVLFIYGEGDAKFAGGHIDYFYPGWGGSYRELKTGRRRRSGRPGRLADAPASRLQLTELAPGATMGFRGRSEVAQGRKQL